jgi:predicted unusual protein kinase regulating ubiquinone biosynthesis (AarF/ABC1/UbiB family)
MTKRERGRAARGAKLGFVAVSHASRTAAGRAREPFLSDEDKARARDTQVLRLADDLVTTLGSMKGAAMKLGQMLSLLNFGLSTAQARDEFSLRLAPLFRKAPPVDNSVMFALLDRELGAYRARLASVEPQPIAAASLGQVYRGTLIDGRAVAVKVQYPSAQSAVRADLKNLALLVKLRARAHPQLGLDVLVQEISEQIRLELDYDHELANHREVFQSHRGHPVFRIPEPIEDLCTSRVLITEYLQGTELDQLDGASQQVRDRVGEAVYRFYCGNLYLTGRFCADPHPGNVLALEDGTVGFVDFGLFVRMQAAEIALERSVFAAVLCGDVETAYASARAAGFLIDEQAMDYLQTVAAWQLAPGITQVTAKTVHKSLSQAVLLSSDYRSAIYRQTLPRAHAFSRRTEMSTWALLGALQARQPWRAIAEEWILGAEPATDMGLEIARWRRADGDDQIAEDSPRIPDSR